MQNDHVLIILSYVKYISKIMSASFHFSECHKLGIYEGDTSHEEELWGNSLPSKPDQPSALGPLTRMEHMLVWKMVILSSSVPESLYPRGLSRDFQPQKCTH